MAPLEHISDIINELAETKEVKGQTDASSTEFSMPACWYFNDTEKAIMVRFPPDGDAAWIPKSQINFDKSEIKSVGDMGYLVVSKWIAKKKGWV